MQWHVVGGANLRRVEEGCSPTSNLSALPYDIGPLNSPVDMYVDDTFGVERSDHVRVARDRVVLVSEGVLAPGTAISTEKSVLASSACRHRRISRRLSGSHNPSQGSGDRQALLCFIQFQLFRSTTIGAMAVSLFIGKYVLTCDPWDAPFCGPHHST